MNLAQRLARAQVTRAALFAALAVVLTALAVPVAAGLPLRSGFVELLPSTAASVRDLRRAEGRVGGTSTLTLVATSNDSDALVRWAEAVGPRLEALPRSLGVRSVEWNVRGYQRFVHDHRLMYAPLDELARFRDDLRRTIEHQRRAAMPGFIDLDDPPEPADALLRRAREQAERAESSSRFPRGVFLHRDGHHLAVFLRADVRAGDADNARALARRVDAEVAATNPTSFAPDLRVERAGDLTVALAEHDAISKELMLATTLTLALCLAVVLGLFRRVRAVPLLGAALLVPVAVTFAFARLAVGHLNTSTAFLGSIVIGNGVNPGIVWLARYFEERRRGREVTDAVAAAHRGAWAGTLTASLAASLAYGSLVITDFRGFRDFGVIGGFGMVICWSLTLLLLPSFVALSERVSPLRLSLSADANPYGRFFARLARRWPRGLAGGALALARGGAVAAGLAVAHDPLEYDFRKLTSVRSATARASRLNGIAGEIVGRAGSGSAVAVLVNRREDVAPLRASLERARDEHGAPYGPVRSIDDLLPKEQPAKVEVLRDLRALLLDARPYANERVRAEIDANLPPADPRPLTDDDLPATAAGLFTERDGSRGRLLFVEEKPGASIWDGRYLVAWSDAIRGVRAPGGRRPMVVGNAPVYADMIAAIWRDGPRAVLASLLATAALVVLSFRAARARGLTLATLFVGVAWMAGLLAALRLRLNFLSFVALPITFGIGVDYAVNVVRRYAQEVDDGGPDPVGAAVSETGGAVVACSLTTIFGYGSLLTSANRALNSFGLAAVIGEVTCLLAAVLALPAALVLVERRRRSERPSQADEGVEGEEPGHAAHP